MELIITEKPPSVCLNMIVKNESHIIIETLEMLCKKILFSYWVICDTGSTDNTRELITTFFKEKNIPGELHTHEWTNFAHNRTLALNEAFGKTDLLFVFDADDELHGDFNIPTTVDADGYFLHFGDSQGISYSRILLVNNRIRWEYQSVIHEYINCLKPNPVLKHINSEYYVVSGRRGSRSQDPNKYLKDAKVLEEAHAVAIKADDKLYLRYAFYCANSYKDAGKHEEAIKWYKITLGQENWVQEKYNSCLNLYDCYNSLSKQHEGFFYLVESLKYDTERVDALYHLVVHYCCNDLNNVAYNYYRICKKFYENSYLNANMIDKLFINIDIYNLKLPYYMIIVSDRVSGEYPEASNTIAKMYEIIFTKKYETQESFYIGNMLYNLTIYIDLCIREIPNFMDLFQKYIDFLVNNKYPLHKHDFLEAFEKHGLKLPGNPLKIVVPIKTTFSQEECIKSKRILFYTGFSNINWNYSYSMNHALGGSETAVAYLSKAFPSDYEIYIGGSVAEEKYDNINYINFDTMHKILNTMPFHTVIVSRYIAFYELFQDVSFYKSFIWGHDVLLYPYGCEINEYEILSKWTHKINGCICQTEWHANLFKSLYPQLNDKMFNINNGLIIDLFKYKSKKVQNRFMYSSCSERGLSRLLQLWPEILEKIPDAELMISSYNPFPQNEDEIRMLSIINKYSSSIKHLGCLSRDKLYEVMATVEYWMYTSYFPETSCITAMELLTSEVICLYYPIAGLVNTIGDYGIQISEGNEITKLLDLTNSKKNELKIRGREYGLSCSWENRANEWSKLMFDGEQLQRQIKNQNNIRIVNLKKREDRKQNMIHQFERENITNYEFIEAVDGSTLKETEELQLLFDGNNFNYRKGIMGCALSHLNVYNNLINDYDNDYYVVLEDDVELHNNFKNNLDKITAEFVKQGIEHLALALSLSNNESDIPLISSDNNNEIQFFEKNVYKLWNITFAYIISKTAAQKIINFINNCSIKCACDNPQAYGELVKYHYPSIFIVKHPEIEIVGSDINSNADCLQFSNTTKTNKKNLKIAYCDWWHEEYCGGSFDLNNNFITDILRKYGNIDNLTVVHPYECPDILLYSIFGNEHLKYTNVRRVFFSGEPFGIRAEADFNLTFDRNSDKNTRVPLWLGYLNDYLLEECHRRKNGIINVPMRENFCSFISNGEVKTTHRRTFVEKLSAYKKVHCGGAFLNNIGYTVPRGVNCSGKIEHNNKYKFAIAFENEDYPGYVTEKICDIYKSNCIPIYWGTKEVIMDFNPTTFINANDFANFDELVEYVIRVDNDDTLYASYFKEPMFSNKWMDAFNDPNKSFYKNLADCIIGKNTNLCDNYFTNIDDNKETIVLYGIEWTYRLIKDYINIMKQKYNVSYVTNINHIQVKKIKKILCINAIYDTELFNRFKNVEIGILNIDSLYISCYLNNILNIVNLYPNIKIYDYSLANIEVLKQHNINYGYLEYMHDEAEVEILKEINNQPKIYDFGIICYTKVISCSKRRKVIVDKIINNGFTVNVVCGFERERDVELGKCKIILNIHSQSHSIETRTFEHLRCNRLLYAGFKILSEVSYLDNDFILKFSNNLKFIKYDDFENITRQNIDEFNFDTSSCNNYKDNKSISVFNIWHNKLFDKCYNGLDEYSLNKITMYDVNQTYEKVYNKEKKYKILKEYELTHYNSLYQATNYCQTSCLYHIFKNNLHVNDTYIGFIQYDMELAYDFIYDMEQKINSSSDDFYFYSLAVANKIEVNYICKPYNNSILEKYNGYFNTNHTYDTITADNKSDKFICLHTFVIPTKTFIKMMTWYCSITDWLHANYINGIYSESMSEVTEEIFGLFLLLQMIENDSIKLETLKLHHEWPNLHNETTFNNYKEQKPYYSLDKIVNNKKTDKNTCHSYLETYDKLFKGKQLTCKNVLEIGIGDGGSMKLWNDYFVNANIYGVVIDKVPDFLKEYNRVKCLKIDTYSQTSIDYFLNKHITFDLIIDDGLHTLESMIYAVKNYTQLLSDDGILIIEDIQDINWCNILRKNIDKSLHDFIEIYDLRYIKNRWDDILLVINKTNNTNDYNNIDTNNSLTNNQLKVEYGTDFCRVNVTKIALRIVVNNVLHIPKGNHNKDILFGDPMPGIIKTIFINNTGYDDNLDIIYNL